MISNYLLEAPNIGDFEKKGFLVLSVTKEVINCIDSIFAQAIDFYQNPELTKKISSIPELNEGWRGLGGEFSISPEVPDLHESFWVTQKQKELISSIYSKQGIDLYNKMYECITMYNDIERSLTRMLLEYFGQDSAPSFNCDRDSDMQVLFYQPELHNRELLQEPHDDSLYMTFAKATAPGLEILLSDGLFHKVELDRNEVLVMPGEILALMAGYRIKPLIHQVVRYSDQKSRFSLGYFTLPNIERGANISPWVSNNSNNHINIMDRVIHNQNQYLVADKSQPQEIKNLTISES